MKLRRTLSFMQLAPESEAPLNALLQGENSYGRDNKQRKCGHLIRRAGKKLFKKWRVARYLQAGHGSRRPVYFHEETSIDL